MDARLHRTYELFLTAHDGVTRFEALTCPPDRLVYDLVRARLAVGDVRSIEVKEGGEHRFIVSARNQ